MSTTEMPAALAGEVAETADEAEAAEGRWIETALAVGFSVIAILFASVLAVVTDLL